MTRRIRRCTGPYCELVRAHDVGPKLTRYLRADRGRVSSYSGKPANQGYISLERQILVGDNGIIWTVDYTHGQYPDPFLVRQFMNSPLIEMQRVLAIVTSVVW